MGENKYLIEDFYYCEDPEFCSENESRVFRLRQIKSSNDHKFFYVMGDDMYAKEGYNTFLSNMRLATDDEIVKYVEDLYINVENDFNLYDVTPEIESGFNKLLIALWNGVKIFNHILKNLPNLNRDKIYHLRDKVVFNVLRSYYKCRILKI